MRLVYQDVATMGDAMVGSWGDSAYVRRRIKTACGRTETSNFLTDRRHVKKTAASIFTVKTNEITRKHLILCSSISDKWQKTLKTPSLTR